MAVPDDAHCYGSIDNWFFLMQRDGGCSLMNPFSKATVDLPKLATVWRQDWFNAHSKLNPLFYKVVVPSPLDNSPEPLVAVLILDDGNYSRVCICQPPVATDMSRGWSMEPSTNLYDVAFFNGKLYGSAFHDRLLMFEIGYDLGNKPKISSTKCIINSMDACLRYLPRSLSRAKVYMIREYLVECCDRLLRVRRFIHNDFPNSTSFCTVGFAIFEADLSTNPDQWRRVNKLGGQALFIGQHCSKSFAVEEFNGIQEDCIYFMCEYAWPDPGDPLRDSGVYNIRNGMITPLLSQNAPVLQHNSGQWRPTWIFPADPM
jgi:hypothetical protein